VEGFLFLENVGIFLFMEKKNLLPISEWRRGGYTLVLKSVIVRWIGKLKNSVGSMLWKQKGDGQLGYHMLNLSIWIQIYLCEAGCLHFWTFVMYKVIFLKYIIIYPYLTFVDCTA
jgi:hypothetical protein